MDILFWIIIASIAVYLVYELLFYFSIGNKKATKEGKEQPYVSVIICARNEAENLEKHLPEVLHQEYPEFEVIVANDDSNDGTAQYLDQMTKQFDHLRVIHMPPKAEQQLPGKKAALKAAMDTAKADIVVLTDADCKPGSEHWIKSMVAEFNGDTEFVLGVSPYNNENSWLNLIIQYETLQTAIQYLAFAILGKPYMGVGRNLAYRKANFYKILSNKAFTNNKSGDDDILVHQLANKKNTRVCINPAGLVWSIPASNWGEWWHQKLRHLSVGRTYDPLMLLILMLYPLSLNLVYFSTLLKLYISGFNISIILVLTLVLSVHAWVRMRLASKLGFEIGMVNLIMSGPLYLLYLSITAVMAAFQNRVEWR